MITQVAGGSTPIYMHPELGYVIEAPAPLMEGRAFERAHNRAVKTAMRFTLLDHWQKTLPKHFKRGNRSKYKHKERSKVYRDIKKQRTGSVTDLVRTGRTKRKITGQLPKIQIGGTSKTVVRGRIIYRFPFPVSRENKPGRVTVDQMAEEIGTIPQDELNRIARQFGSSYSQALAEEINNSPTLKKKLGRT